MYKDILAVGNVFGDSVPVRPVPVLHDGFADACHLLLERDLIYNENNQVKCELPRAQINYKRTQLVYNVRFIRNVWNGETASHNSFSLH